MNLKEKLLKLKNELPVPRALEFDATFEDHPVGNQDIYRLYFVNYYRKGESYGRKGNNVGVIDWACKPFMLPEGMSREEGFKVLSYLTNFIEKTGDIEPCSLKSVMTLDKVLDLERFGFKRVIEYDENKILNLFTVRGRLLLFKRSKLYQKYFEWYVENVTLEEVTNIYAKLNMKFRNIVWSGNRNDKGYSKVLNIKKIKVKKINKNELISGNINKLC